MSDPSVTKLRKSDVPQFTFLLYDVIFKVRYHLACYFPTTTLYFVYQTQTSMKLYSIITFRNFFTQVYATLFDVIELSRPHTLGIVMDSYIRQIKRVLTEMIKFVSRIESFIVEYTLTSAGVSQKKRSSTDVSANDCFNKLFDTLLTYNSL